MTASFPGFPRGTRYTPVPNLLFGPLLEQVNDLAEWKCMLRLLWLAAQKRAIPQAVQERELVEDRTLLRALGTPAEVQRGLALAVQRGTLLRVASPQGVAYLLHTQANAETAARLGWTPATEGPTAMEATGPVGHRPNIFALYEGNIGMLTPMLAEELKEAEANYPQEWIEAAIREAVSHNRRSWRYIARILERWAIEGRDHGEPGRHPKTIGAEEYIRRHGLP
ncbi:MAG: DnaD domain protein [Chloroflexi bacterium]|nr:DnaD domain protein [Chloroflexota bacterium]